MKIWNMKIKYEIISIVSHIYLFINNIYFPQIFVCN